MFLLCLVLCCPAPHELSGAGSHQAPDKMHPLEHKLERFVLHKPSQASHCCVAGHCGEEELSLTTAPAKDVVSEHKWRTIQSPPLLLLRREDKAMQNYEMTKS